MKKPRPFTGTDYDEKAQHELGFQPSVLFISTRYSCHKGS